MRKYDEQEHAVERIIVILVKSDAMHFVGMVIRISRAIPK